MDMKVNKKLNDSPCLDCPDREPGCHGKCEKYAKWVEPIVKAREARKQRNEAMNYEIDRMVKERQKKRRNNNGKG